MIRRLLVTVVLTLIGCQNGSPLPQELSAPDQLNNTGPTSNITFVELYGHWSAIPGDQMPKLSSKDAQQPDGRIFNNSILRTLAAAEQDKGGSRHSSVRCGI